MKSGIRFALIGLFLLLTQVSFAGARYSIVRTYKVDGKTFTLAEGEKRLDLDKIYPGTRSVNRPGSRLATVEATVESDADKTVPFYYINEWYGELLVNGVSFKKGLEGPSDALLAIEIPLKKGTNVVALRTCAGNAGWYCLFAFDGTKVPGQADGCVDLTKTIGKIRPQLHSAGFGPTICSCPKETIDEIRSMNLTAARTHDWALINPNERVCDYFQLFPFMHLDATKPENYHFAPTDYLLKRTREETGLDVFFRLGTSIEHSGTKIHFNTLIPEDFDKVAEIFASTVRHYNQGWANGHAWDIKYWEIWNEPDGFNNMWCLPEGDLDEDSKVADEKTARRRELFTRFFITCLKRLKSEFPTIKVGGPALCYMNKDYFRHLLRTCRAENVAPDFISWHYYGNSVESILATVDEGRKLCDEFGFSDCQLILNEWHYLGCSWVDLRSADPKVQERVWSGPSSHNGTDAAAFTLSTLARFQASSLDQSYYYGCKSTGSWGYKDERKHPYKVYYALKLFGEIVKDYPVLGDVKTTESLTTLVARSADGQRTVLLAVDYCGLPGDVVLEVAGLPEKMPTVRVLDHTRNFESITVRREGNRLILPKADRASASYFIAW